MSRIGKKPVPIPKGVNVELKGKEFKAKGPKGELGLSIHDKIDVKIDNDTIVVERHDDEKFSRSLHGLTRSLINNIIIGVSQGFEKKLQIIGTGYSAKVQGDKLTLKLGYSHPIEYQAPKGIKLATPNATTIVVSGADKHQVGQIAANIREFRPPEVYHGKGIRYFGEEVRHKAGKAGAK